MTFQNTKMTIEPLISEYTRHQLLLIVETVYCLVLRIGGLRGRGSKGRGHPFCLGFIY